MTTMFAELATRGPHSERRVSLLPKRAPVVIVVAVGDAARRAPEQLLSAVDVAIQRSQAACLRDAALQTLRGCYASLTPREREVMGLVVSGLLTTQVASELGISEITVKAHRGQVTRKMKADSLPHLVRMAARLDVVLADSAPDFM